MATDQQNWNIQELGAGDVSQRLQAGCDTIVVPLGSCERHGNPFTPLGLDGLVSYAVSERAAREAEVFHTPLVGFGYAPEHFGRMGEGCGTVSFRAETYRRMLEDISRCLIFHGFNKLIFVSFHSSNAGVMEEVLFSVRSHTGAFVAVYRGRENKQTQEILQSAPARLSSDIEAAIAMALMGEKFNTRGYLSHGYEVHSPEWLGPEFSKKPGTGISVEFGGAANIFYGMEDYEYVRPLAKNEPTPSQATPEKGLKLLEMLGSQLSAFVQQIKPLMVKVKSRDYPSRVR